MEQRYIIFQGITNKSGQNNASKSRLIWGLYSAYFAFGKSIRKIKTMVQLQVAMCTIAKSRSQIKQKPNKGMSMDANLIFSMAGALRRSMLFLQV